MTITSEERAKSNVATLVHYARNGGVTTEMEAVAQKEGLPLEQVIDEVATGKIIIPANVGHRSLRPVGIGLSCHCKINANIGTSSLVIDVNQELEKMHTALRYGADTIMDLSSGGDVERLRQILLEQCPAPFGTVPIYEALARAGKIEDLTDDAMIEVIRCHAEQGVDFITLHCGLLRDHIPLTEKRLTGIVSRGGSIVAQWMIYNGRENPLYERFGEILDICRRYDVTLSLGDGLRPGCLADASDEAQFAELETIASLLRRCQKAEVQVMIEGPGHVPFDQIGMNVEKQQKDCGGAPFYVLGPLVTDIAPGYDHISGAIGATMAAISGASLLCCVTPKEHLGLPDVEDVRQGVVAFKIAAHAADIARGRRGAREKDDAISRARFAFDWEGMFQRSIDPERARQYFVNSGKDFCSLSTDYCSMCGPGFCAMRLSKMIKEGKIRTGKN